MRHKLDPKQKTCIFSMCIFSALIFVAYALTSTRARHFLPAISACTNFAQSMLYATRLAVDFKHRRGMKMVNQRQNEMLVANQNRQSLMPTYTADPLSELRVRILQTVSSQTMLLATFKRFSLQTGTGNSVISFNNFKRGLKACGVTLPESSIVSLFNRLDKDGDGHIDLGEFASGIFHKQHTSLKSTKDHYVAVCCPHTVMVYVFLATHASVTRVSSYA